MKIKSPIVTLLVGVLIAVVITVLSIRAHNRARGPYGEVAPPAVFSI